jgi:hypothetical protein
METMIRRLLATLLLCLAGPVAAQSVPAADYTDMWYLPSESGWGISFTQHARSSQAYAVWYTYDPREADPVTPGNFRPLWLVMAGGNWTSPTRITGPVYVLNGTPFDQSGSNRSITAVGTFTFDFASASSATFTYDIAPPAGLPASDPAYGLPAFSGSKAISRQSF